MKKICAFIFALTFISQALFCQVSNVVEGSNWKEVRCNYWASIFNGVYFVDNWRIEGDTIINGVWYKKLYNLEQVFMFGTVAGSSVDVLVEASDNYYGGIREENQQVFIHSQAFVVPDAPLTEKMMFDYAASVGDTVSIWCGSVYLDYAIEDIVPVEMYDGSVRNKFILDGNAGTGFFGLSFIEGIGCNYGVVGSYIAITNDQMQHLLCYSINHTIILENSAEYTSNCLVDPIQESCGTVILSDRTTANSEHRPFIYPNPTSDVLNFTLHGGGVHYFSYRLYTTAGSTLIAGVSMGSKPIHIDVSTIPSGLYFLEVVLDNSERFVEKVIVLD